MVIKMNNKKIITLTLFIIAGMVIVPTIYKIYKEHNNNLVLVVEKEFAYYAKKCYNEDKCQNKTIYLKELYENKYLEERLTNPLNKKYYKEDSYINLETQEIKLIS